MKEMLQELQTAMQRVGLNMNYSKTKIMTNLVPNKHIQTVNRDIEYTMLKNIYLCTWDTK